MTTPAKRVEIEARIIHNFSGDVAIISMDTPPGVLGPCDDLDLSATSLLRSATVWVHDAHAAREYAQMLRGAADQLVEYAEAQEAEANARSESIADPDDAAVEDPALARKGAG